LYETRRVLRRIQDRLVVLQQLETPPTTRSTLDEPDDLATPTALRTMRTNARHLTLEADIGEQTLDSTFGGGIDEDVSAVKKAVQDIHVGFTAVSRVGGGCSNEMLVGLDLRARVVPLNEIRQRSDLELTDCRKAERPPHDSPCFHDVGIDDTKRSELRSRQFHRYRRAHASGSHDRHRRPS
jgi:hypothetical protein